MAFAYAAAPVGFVTLALAGCTAASAPPDGGAPSYHEQLALYATNRARVAPALEGFASYGAVPPLQWNAALGRVARTHAIDMRDTPCFQHASCDGTDAFVRIRRGYTGPWTDMAENISSGVADGRMVVSDWLAEIGAATGETGDRDHIFSPAYSLIGIGFANGGSARQNLWTQDFVGTPVVRPAMTDGIHFPEAPAANARVNFGVTYHAPSAPPQVAVVVQGTCKPLPLSRGTRDQGAYEGWAPAGGSGCVPYYFTALGETYPATGSLQLGVGDAGCDLFVDARADPDGGIENCNTPPDGGLSDARPD
jgi:uncharacterized protein YkwD